MPVYPGALWFADVHPEHMADRWLANGDVAGQH
jgi:hypothetical protein